MVGTLTPVLVEVTHFPKYAMYPLTKNCYFVW